MLHYLCLKHTDGLKMIVSLYTNSKSKKKKKKRQCHSFLAHHRLQIYQILTHASSILTVLASWDISFSALAHSTRFLLMYARNRIFSAKLAERWVITDQLPPSQCITINVKNKNKRLHISDKKCRQPNDRNTCAQKW